MCKQEKTFLVQCPENWWGLTIWHLRTSSQSVVLCANQLRLADAKKFRYGMPDPMEPLIMPPLLTLACSLIKARYKLWLLSLLVTKALTDFAIMPHSTTRSL